MFELYSDRVFGVAYTYTRSSQLAEEVVQDIFLKIWSKREKLGAVNELQDYIFIITRNHILNLLRGIAREKAFLEGYREAQDTEIAAPEAVYLQKESSLILEEAVLRLPPQQRAIYHLNQRKGLKLGEVAVTLNLSRNTVRNHLFRAMVFIREYVRKHGCDAGLLFLLIKSGIFFVAAGTFLFFRGLYY